LGFYSWIRTQKFYKEKRQKNLQISVKPIKTVDYLLEQLNVLNQNYIWIIVQGEQILSEVDKAMAAENFEKVEKLRDRFIELENRHNRDRKTYNDIIKQSRSFFKSKYNLDLFDYFELEDI